MNQTRTDLTSRSFDAKDPQSALLAAEIAELNLKVGAKDDSAVINDQIKPFAAYNYWKVPAQYDLDELLGEMEEPENDKQKKDEGSN